MYVYASISRAKSSSVIVYQLFVYVWLSFTSSWAFRGQRWLLFIFASSMPSIVPGTKYEKCSINVNWMTEWTNFQQISRLYLCPHFVSYPHRDLLVYQKGDKRDSDSFGAHKRMLALFSYYIRKRLARWNEKGPYPQRDLGTYVGFVTMPVGWPWLSYLTLKVLNSLICKIRIHTSWDSSKE